MPSQAPGKIILTGEYAVLSGYPAVAISVNRYTKATVTSPTLQKSYFLQEVIASMAIELGSHHKAIECARSIQCDSSEFKQNNKKLGLGSSAAVTVSAIHEVLSKTHDSLDKNLVHRIAHHAHRNAQKRLGAAGSGVDIAVATFGGVLKATSSNSEKPCFISKTTWPSSLQLSFLFLNKSASTPSLVNKFLAAGSKTELSTEKIGRSSVDFFDSLQQNNPSKAIASFHQGYTALLEMENAASMSIVPPFFHSLVEKACSLGGAFKTTGAGGGDMAVAMFTSSENKRIFEKCAEEAGLSLLPLQQESLGVHQL